MSMRGEEKSGIYRLHGYCARAVFREVFFVSAAQRKSQKTRGPQRQTAFFAVCVHRGAGFLMDTGAGEGGLPTINNIPQ